MQNRLEQLHRAMGLHHTGAGADDTRPSPPPGRHIDVLGSLQHHPAIGDRGPLPARAVMMVFTLVVVVMAGWVAQTHGPLRSDGAADAPQADRRDQAARAPVPPPSHEAAAAHALSAVPAAQPGTPRAETANAVLLHVTAPPPLTEAIVAERLESWRQAWAARDVDAYLAHYSAEFVPPNGQTRATWAATRRRIISTRPEITLRVHTVVLQAVSHQQWQARFLQDYAAAGHVENDVPKTLDWVLEDGIWRIAAERQASPAARSGSR